jgi:hypothetical protein
MAAKSEALGFKIRSPGQASGAYKRFSVTESLESITLAHIWSGIRSSFPSDSFFSESHGIYVVLSKNEPLQLELATSDQQLRSLIQRIGATDKILIECKEKEEENYVIVDSSCTSPKELPKSEHRSTPGTAPRATVSGHALGGQLNPGGDVSAVEEINLLKLAETFELYSNSVVDCKGKKSVVLFGQTGSGKTSTSLFFLGARLVTKDIMAPKTMRDGTVVEEEQEILAMDDSDSSRFEGFNISHINKSETKVVTAKRVDTTGFQVDAQSSQLQDLYVADLPGFADSQGFQTDIGQCVAALNAIKNMHGIWPVFLIKCDAIGGRANVSSNLKPLLQLITRIFSPIEDYVPSEQELKSGAEGRLHFLFTNAEAKHTVTWLSLELDKLCDPSYTDDLGGPDVTRLVQYMFYYVRAFQTQKQAGLLVIRKEDLVTSGASSHPCVTLKRIVSAKLIRETPSLKCPLAELTLSKLVAKVNEEASVIKHLFTHDPPQFIPACKSLQLLFVISNAVCDETVKEVFENALQFVGQQIRSLLESTHAPMQSRDFDRLHTSMLTMKNCIEALKPHSVLRELHQDVDVKKKELTRSVTQIANEARATFFPADGEWTPSDDKEDKDRLQTLQKIEEAFFKKGSHQFISQTADQRYPQVIKHLQAIVCKHETNVTDNMNILHEFAVAETTYVSECRNIVAAAATAAVAAAGATPAAAPSDDTKSLQWPQPLEAVDTATALFKSLTISKCTMDNYDDHLSSSFLKLREDFRRFLSVTFQDSLLSSYCQSMKSFHLYMFSSRLVTCLDFLKELETNSVLHMIERPATYESEVSRVRQMYSGIFGDIDSNFQSKQYSLVQRDLQFLRKLQSCVHLQQFLPDEICLKVQIIDRSIAKLCDDVKQYVQHFKDRETLELCDCQKMVDLLKELYTAQCLQPSENSAAAAESKWSVAATLDASLDVLTSECKTRCQSFGHGFMRHDSHAVVLAQLIRLSRMTPLQDLVTIRNSANATPTIVADFHNEMKGIVEGIIFATADSHSTLNWQSLETEICQLESRLVSIQWLTTFFERPQDKFAGMSGFGRHECFIDFVTLCEQRHEFLKRKLDEFKGFFKEKIEEQKAVALLHIQTINPATDMPLLKQALDFMKEFMDVACINAFMSSIPSKLYLSVIDKLKDKIGTLVMDTAAAFEKTNYECVTPNRDYFDRVSLHISHHLPESVNIGEIITRFCKQHSASTIQMRENLPLYLSEDKFVEIAVCLMNLQRTKDSEPNDKTLFEGFNDKISAHLSELLRQATDASDENPVSSEAISNLQKVLEKSERTLRLHAVEVSGQEALSTFQGILKCCWDKFEELEKRYVACCILHWFTVMILQYSIKWYQEVQICTGLEIVCFAQEIQVF